MNVVEAAVCRRRGAIPNAGRLATVLALIATLLLHGSSAGGVVAWQFFNSIFREAEKARKTETPEEQDEPERRFTLIDAEETEPPDPQTTKLESHINARAAEEAPDPSLPQGGPRSTRGRQERIQVRRTGLPAAARRTAIRPPLRPSRPSPPVTAARTAKSVRHPPRPKDEAGYLPPAPKEVRQENRDRTPRRPRPKIKPIGEAARPAGVLPTRNTSTSTRMQGNRALNVLKSRYGEYMDKVLRKIEQAWYAEIAAAPTQPRAGSVRIRFGIDADGKVIDLAVIGGTPGLTVERDWCLQALREAGPFPPLTKAMQDDTHVREIEILFYYL